MENVIKYLKKKRNEVETQANDALQRGLDFTFKVKFDELESIDVFIDLVECGHYRQVVCLLENMYVGSVNTSVIADRIRQIMSNNKE